MQAVTIDKFGEYGRLQELPNPSLSAGDVLVDVHVAAINPFDWMVRDGRGGDRSMPLTLGQDFAGTVASIASADAAFHIGDRVFGIAGKRGSYASRTIVTSAGGDVFAAIPPTVSDDQAAALPTPGLTALACLEALQITQGSVLVIYGAGGAVGDLSRQMAMNRGARVIAIVRGAEAVERASGAAAIIDTANTTDLLGAIDAAHAGRIDAVLDLVDMDPNKSLQFADLLGAGAVFVSTLGSANVDAFAKRGAIAINIDLFATPQANRQSLERVVSMVAQGQITVTVANRYPLTEAPDVLNQVKSGKLRGKTVLHIT